MCNKKSASADDAFFIKVSAYCLAGQNLNVTRAYKSMRSTYLLSRSLGL
ncbi:MAG: hypothetical protein ACJAZP_003239 [Psychromonas sp.]|jgi:hypothetical protein